MREPTEQEIQQVINKLKRKPKLKKLRQNPYCGYCGGTGHIRTYVIFNEGLQPGMPIDELSGWKHCNECNGTGFGFPKHK